MNGIGDGIMKRVNKYRWILTIGIINVIFYTSISRNWFTDQKSTLILGIILSFHGSIGVIMADFFDRNE